MSVEKATQYSEMFAHFDYFSKGTIHYLSLSQILSSMEIEVPTTKLLELLAETGNQNETEIQLHEFLAIIST